MKLAAAEDLRIYMSLKMHDPVKIIGPDMKAHNIVAVYDDDDGNPVFQLDTDEIFSYEDLLYYRPEYDGAVNAIRIYLEDGYKPMADLALAYGGKFTFEWDRCDIREMFSPSITAYTIFYDTRANQPFLNWVKPLD